MNLSDWLMMRRESPGAGPSQRQTPVIEELTGIGDEVIITLVYERMGWDIHALCYLSLVSRRLNALAGRILWREVCLNRAPKMTLFLMEDGRSNRIMGFWQALAKLMFYCVGCRPTTHFELGCPSPGHFVRSARFSRTSGRSFVPRRCHGDELFMSNVCEHPNTAGQGSRRNLSLGVYRGVYRSFESSRTRRILVRMDMGFVEEFRCTFCRARMWSMTAAGLIPSQRAAKWLSTRNGRLEYFVCVNGHLHGACWLLRLAPQGEVSDEANTEEDSFMDSGDDDDDDDMEV